MSRDFIKHINYIVITALNSRIKLIYIVVLFLFLALFDLIGVSILLPYINLLLDKNKFISLVENYNYFNFNLDLEQNTLFLYFSSILVVFFIVKSFLVYYVHYVLLKFAQDSTFELKLKLANSYFTMPYSLYTKRNSADSINTVQNLSAYSFESVIIPLMKIFSDILIIITLAFFLAFIDIFSLLSVLFILIISIFLYSIVFRKILYISGEKKSIGGRLQIRGIKEGLFGFKELTVLNKIGFFRKIYFDGICLIRKQNIVFRLINTIPSTFLEVLTIIFFVGLCMYKILFSYSTFIEQVPILAVIAFTAFKLFPKFTSISHSISSINNGKYALNIVYDDLITIDKIRENNINDLDDQQKNKKIDFHSIKLKNISYQYNSGGEFSLKNINLSFSKGDKIGIIGQSGSGKTTLIDVILGFLEPSEGDVLINNNLSLKKIDTKIWHKNISYLPQEICFTDSTILQNITLSINTDDINEKKLNESIRLFKLQGIINSFNEGINYKIGENGVGLSGGQKQRIALARSFYHDRKIIILDEATNSLDSESEEEIINELFEVGNEITLIIIAHRHSILKKCNHVIEIKNGQIKKSGTYDEIVKDG